MNCVKFSGSKMLLSSYFEFITGRECRLSMNMVKYESCNGHKKARLSGLMDCPSGVAQGTQCFPQWCMKKSWSGVNPDQQLWFENEATCLECGFSHSFLPFYGMLKGSRMQEHSLYVILPILRLLTTKEKNLVVISIS